MVEGFIFILSVVCVVYLIGYVLVCLGVSFTCALRNLRHGHGQCAHSGGISERRGSLQLRLNGVWHFGGCG